MKLISTSWNSTKQAMDLDDAARATIMSAHAEDQIHRLTEQVENAANMVGRLLAMLEERRLLRDDEILTVLGDCYEIAEDNE